MNHLFDRLCNWTIAIAIPVLAIGALLAVLFLWRPDTSDELAKNDVWTCSMHPQVRLPQPGQCPICEMPLIPVSELSAERARVEQGAGLETEAVTHRELFKEIRTIGKVDYNQQRLAFITARVDGRVERVYADVAGITIKANDHLVDIFSPALNVAQAELLSALEAHEQTPNDRFAQSGVESARTKLPLLGILPEQVAEIENQRQVKRNLTIYAPIGGVIIEKNVRDQQYVQKGEMLYRIAELDPIWLYLDIYEYDLAWIRYGQPVEVSVEAYPGETFGGTIVFIDPFLNDESRTVKVRVNLKNPGYRLKPAMYATAAIHVRLQSDGTPQPTGLEGKFICPMHPEIVRDEPGQCDICQMPLERVPDVFPVKPVAAVDAAPTAGTVGTKVLAIRKSAVLDTGRRKVAYHKRNDGAYELVELKLGPLAESKDESGRVVSYFPVLAGLNFGDKVVVEGGFLLDSQRQIEGMPSLLYAEGQSATELHAGHGGEATPSSAPAPAATEHKH
ncbi:MAG: efflux RND transporter periplasmic adaptor subunit [Pirellulales bacterium]